MSAAPRSHEQSERLGSGSKGGGAAARLARIARACVTAPIVVYGRFVSPALPRRCKYEPTCSAYAIEAVRCYGVMRGLVLAAWRLLRCNPFSDGGYDPVEAQSLFGPRDGSASRPHAGAGGR